MTDLFTPDKPPPPPKPVAKIGPNTNDDGSKATENEVHAFLLDQLAMGRKLLPMSKDCVGFDYQTGCPGHEDTP